MLGIEMKGEEEVVKNEKGWRKRWGLRSRITTGECLRGRVELKGMGGGF
jgi:hypothetical protein